MNMEVSISQPYQFDSMCHLRLNPKRENEITVFLYVRNAHKKLQEKSTSMPPEEFTSI
jgi:hypothetical protein